MNYIFRIYKGCIDYLDKFYRYVLKHGFITLRKIFLRFVFTLNVCFIVVPS